MSIIGDFRNIFSNFGITRSPYGRYPGPTTAYPNHRITTSYSRSSIVDSIFNRISIDASTVRIQHVNVNKGNKDQTVIDSGLNRCLSVEANIDQSYVEFMHDLVYTMFDKGVVAVVPVDYDEDISDDIGAIDVVTLRVGVVQEWKPKHIRIELYNENTGKTEVIEVPKKLVAIIQNPLYPIINAENSTLTRLLNKIALLDDNDTTHLSSKLNMIFQLPFPIKGATLIKEAEDRLASLHTQLSKSEYGIGYIGSSEKVIPVSGNATNVLFEEIQYLTEQLYNQLGLTKNILNGTASGDEYRAYYSRTIDPIIQRIMAELTRKYLTQKQRENGDKLMQYRDIFAFIPTAELGNLTDSFKRNAVATSNEIRALISFPPSDDPEADRLTNPNISEKNKQAPGSTTSPGNQNGGNSITREE